MSADIAESAGVIEARAAFVAAKEWESDTHDAEIEAKRRADAAEQDVFTKARELNLARAIGVPCPVCDAQTDEPCPAIQPAHHTARSVASRRIGAVS